MLKKISIILIVLLLMVGCSAQTNDTAKTAEVEQVNVEQDEHDYMIKLYETSLKIQNNISICLQWAGEISKHWSEAVQYNKNIDQMVKIVQKTAEDGGFLSNLRTERKDIDVAMNELNNPPEKYKDLYDKLLSYYGEYTTTYDLALNPNGSLISFNNSINTLMSETNKQFNEFKALIPQDIIK